MLMYSQHRVHIHNPVKLQVKPMKQIGKIKTFDKKKKNDHDKISDSFTLMVWSQRNLSYSIMIMVDFDPTNLNLSKLFEKIETTILVLKFQFYFERYF